MAKDVGAMGPIEGKRGSTLAQRRVQPTIEENPGVAERKEKGKTTRKMLLLGF